MTENKQLESTEAESWAALPSLADADPLEIAETLCHVLDMKKARDIKLLRVSDKTIIADYFVRAARRRTSRRSPAKRSTSSPYAASLRREWTATTKVSGSRSISAV